MGCVRSDGGKGMRVIAGGGKSELNALCGGEGCPLSSRELRAPRAGARRQRQGEGKEREGTMSPPPPHNEARVGWLMGWRGGGEARRA